MRRRLVGYSRLEGIRGVETLSRLYTASRLFVISHAGGVARMHLADGQPHPAGLIAIWFFSGEQLGYAGLTMPALTVDGLHQRIRPAAIAHLGERSPSVLKAYMLGLRRRPRSLRRGPACQ